MLAPLYNSVLAQKASKKLALSLQVVSLENKSEKSDA